MVFPVETVHRVYIVYVYKMVYFVFQLFLMSFVTYNYLRVTVVIRVSNPTASCNKTHKLTLMMTQIDK